MTDPDALMPLPEPAEGLPVVPCSECKRPLTGREARRRGVGDDCARKRGWRIGPGVGAFEMPQDGLFGE